MITLISIIVIIVLIIFGLIHIYWAFGGKFALDLAIPTINDKPLINPGKTLTLFVALLILCFAFIVYLIQFSNLLESFYTSSVIYFGYFLSALFTLRAIGEFHAVGFFKKIKSSKFAKYDTLYYSPLSLLLGFYFFIISYMAMNHV